MSERIRYEPPAEVVAWVAGEAQKQLELIPYYVETYPPNKREKRDNETVEQRIEKRTALIWKKVIHTGDVVHAMNDILERQKKFGRVKYLVDAAEHDVARFYQAARYGVTSDKKTGYLHAHHGTFKIINADQNQLPYHLNTSDNLLAIWDHSGFGECDHEQTKYIRDADRLANLRRIAFRLEFAIANGYQTAEKASREPLADFFANKVVTKKGDSAKDEAVQMLSWLSDYYYKETVEIIIEEGLIETLANIVYPDKKNHKLKQGLIDHAYKITNARFRIGQPITELLS